MASGQWLPMAANSGKPGFPKIKMNSSKLGWPGTGWDVPGQGSVLLPRRICIFTGYEAPICRRQAWPRGLVLHESQASSDTVFSKLPQEALLPSLGGTRSSNVLNVSCSLLSPSSALASPQDPIRNTSTLPFLFLSLSPSRGILSCFLFSQVEINIVIIPTRGQVYLFPSATPVIPHSSPPPSPGIPHRRPPLDRHNSVATRGHPLQQRDLFPLWALCIPL